MFENPDFQVDEESEEFRLLNPLVSKISEKRKKKLRLLEQQELHGKVTYCLLFRICVIFSFLYKLEESLNKAVICLTFSLGEYIPSFIKEGIFFPNVCNVTDRLTLFKRE